MAQVIRTFPAFVGGEEKVYEISHTEREEANEPSTSIDLTGYTISAEIWWEGCRHISLSESSGIEINDLFPPDPVEGEEPTPHYIIRLSETQTKCIPHGRVAFMKLIRVDADGITTIRAPIYLNRVA